MNVAIKNKDQRIVVNPSAVMLPAGGCFKKTAGNILNISLAIGRALIVEYQLHTGFLSRR
jgi:hypothetical protein